ncbi:MAG TPA: YihY/virulence factor BrkB family protein [Methylomirabilota bacterium]|nr:YihY/virulence factor BrkB family protein [Methylomirabilota bacterium]
MASLASLLGTTVGDWYEDRAPRIGAALAYYTIFALTPGLVILMTLAGVMLGPGAEARIVEQFRELIGPQGAKAIEATVRSARETSPGTAGLGLALVTLIIGLWGVFGELQDGLNTIWGVTPKPGRRFLDVVRDRFWSFAMVVGTGFLLLVSLVVTAWLAVMGAYLGYLLPAPALALEVINSLISLAVITVAFAVIFKLLPDVRIAWRDVWLGAAVTSLLFTVGKFLIGLYLGKSAVASAYGAAGSLVIIVVWVYYSSQILLLGAEFTKVWTKRRGSGFRVEKTAKPVTAEARAEQGMGPKRR